jgi:hypothetical protein
LKYIGKVEGSNELMRKKGHGRYLSKFSLFLRIAVQDFLVKSIYTTVPQMEGIAFDEFLSETASCLVELSEVKSEKKGILEPILHRGSSKRAIFRKKRLEDSLREGMRRDFNFVQKATEITILGTKDIQLGPKMALRESLAQILRDVIIHERILAEANGEHFDLDDFGLNIIVSFDPKKAGEVPRFAITMQQSIQMREDSSHWKFYEEEQGWELPKELDKLDRISGRDRETLERDKALLKRIRRQFNEMEEEAKLDDIDS